MNNHYQQPNQDDDNIDLLLLNTLAKITNTPNMNNEGNDNNNHNNNLEAMGGDMSSTVMNSVEIGGQLSQLSQMAASTTNDAIEDTSLLHPAMESNNPSLNENCNTYNNNKNSLQAQMIFNLLQQQQQQLQSPSSLQESGHSSAVHTSSSNNNNTISDLFENFLKVLAAAARNNMGQHHINQQQQQHEEEQSSHQVQPHYFQDSSMTRPQQDSSYLPQQQATMNSQGGVSLQGSQRYENVQNNVNIDFSNEIGQHSATRNAHSNNDVNNGTQLLQQQLALLQQQLLGMQHQQNFQPQISDSSTSTGISNQPQQQQQQQSCIKPQPQLLQNGNHPQFVFPQQLFLQQQLLQTQPDNGQPCNSQLLVQNNSIIDTTAKNSNFVTGNVINNEIAWPSNENLGYAPNTDPHPDMMQDSSTLPSPSMVNNVGATYMGLLTNIQSTNHNMELFSPQQGRQQQSIVRAPSNFTAPHDLQQSQMEQHHVAFSASVGPSATASTSKTISKSRKREVTSSNKPKATSNSSTGLTLKRKRKKTFPEKLMQAMIDYGQEEESIAWLPDGRSFVVVNPDRFCTDVLAKAFKESKYASFVRKLHRWGFTRLTSGTGTDCFHHPKFQKGQIHEASLIQCMRRGDEDNNNIKNNDGKDITSGAFKQPSLAGVERFIRSNVAATADSSRQRISGDVR